MTSRRPRRARLDLEALEDRLVPTAPVNPILSVWLGTNGNLNELIGGQERVIDRGVQSFTRCTVNGRLQLFDLSYGGGVKEYLMPGSSTIWTALTGSNINATELLAFNGGLYMLARNGGFNQTVWWYSGSGTNWTALTDSNTNATTLVVANNNLYMLGSIGAGNGAVWEYTPSDGTGIPHADALRIWGSGTNSPGTSWTAATGANTNATALVAFAGNLYMLGSNGAANQTVWQYSGSGTTWTAVTNSNINPTTLVVADGGLYMLGGNGAANQTVWQYTGSVTVYHVYHEDGLLSGGSDASSPGTGWTAVTGSNTNVTELVGAAGSLYMLASIGTANPAVYQYTGSGANWTKATSWPPAGPITTNNSNSWSGYVVAPTSNVTAVAGTWVQPTVSGPGMTMIWVGIDGGNFNGESNDHTVEQIGVFSRVINGVRVCTPFIEFYGDQSGNHQGSLFSEKDIQLSDSSGDTFSTVSPGDTISAEVALVPGLKTSFEFQMTDQPANGGPIETFSAPMVTTQFVKPLRSTAEWIVENPNHAGQPLAQFTPVTFTGAWATIGGYTGPINNFANVVAVNMGSSEGHAVTTNLPMVTNTPGFNEAPLSFASSIFEVSWTGGATSSIVRGTKLVQAVNGSTGLLGSPPVAASEALAQAPGTIAPATQGAHSDEVFSTLGVRSREGLLALSSSVAGEGQTDAEASDLLFGTGHLFS
jgi:hypothetical protein